MYLGKHYLLLSALSDGMRELRTMMDELYLPLQPLYAPATPSAAATLKQGPVPTSASTLGLELPANVHLATLEVTGERELLVRLAHQFAVGEDPVLSQPASVDLFALLAPYQPKAAEELTLSANQRKAEQLAGKIQWPTESVSNGASVRRTDASASAVATAKAFLRKGALSSASSFVVELQPMQIKTFRVELSA